MFGFNLVRFLFDLTIQLELTKLFLFFVSRQAGHRLCNHIDRVMTLLIKYSQQDDDELREFCLQACEAFVQRCPEAIKPHTQTVN